MGGPARNDLEGLAILHEIVTFDGEAATVNGVHTNNKTSSNQQKAQQKDSLIAGPQTSMRHTSAESCHLREMASMQESVAHVLSSPDVLLMPSWCLANRAMHRFSVEHVLACAAASWRKSTGRSAHLAAHSSLTNSFVVLSLPAGYCRVLC